VARRGHRERKSEEGRSGPSVFEPSEFGSGPVSDIPARRERKAVVLQGARTGEKEQGAPAETLGLRERKLGSNWSFGGSQDLGGEIQGLQVAKCGTGLFQGVLGPASRFQRQ